MPAALPVTDVIHEHMLTVDGQQLRVLSAGAGPAVLLLHGFAVDADDWRPTISRLAQAGYQAIAPDALGFGRSAKPGGAAYSLQRYAALNAGLLDTLGIASTAIVGHSMGGKHALATTLLYPDRIKRLIIADSEGFMQLPLFMRKGGTLPLLGEALLALAAHPSVIRMQLKAAFADPERHLTPAVIARGQATLGDPGVRRTMLDLSRNYAANDLKGSGLWSRLSTIRCPTLIIWGAEDRMFAPHYAHMAKAAIPSAELVLIPHCGHFPQLETPEAFHRLLLAFLAEG